MKKTLLPRDLNLEITSLGAMGDGIAEHNGKKVFVPFTCSGDIIEATVIRETKKEIRAEMRALVKASPERQEPACKHFGSCGGCCLQHVSEAVYQQLKRRTLESFVSGIGLDTSIIGPMVEIREHSRRRVDVKMTCQADGIAIGFMGKGTHHLVDIEECPVSERALTAIVSQLRACLGTLKNPERVSSVSLTALEKGVDALFKLNTAIETRDKERLITFAKSNRILRLATQLLPPQESRRDTKAGDMVCVYDEDSATIIFGGVEVALPVGAFLQATQAGQDAITELVTEHLEGCNNIADLYSGCGTYSFPLIKQAKSVSAYEGGHDMVRAMSDACIAHGLSGSIQAHARNLFSTPLTAKELNNFDGIVINPPRNGALPQVTAIGESVVRKVVMVSCDPATFKRDAKQLLASGYQLNLIVPIDQFYWSHHLELVAVFER